MKAPEVFYARSGDVSIAYQVVGDGPVDLVFVRGLAGELLSTWEQPLLVAHVMGFASFSRVLMLDKRGTGLSDRVREVPTLETRMDDVRTVMDAVGSDRAFLWTGQEGGRMTTLFAATYPERTAGLILLDPSAKGLRTASYPWAPTDAEWHQRLRDIREGWGRREFFDKMLAEMSPEIAGEEEFLEWFVAHMRRSLSPGAAVAFHRMMMDADVTEVLSAVRVPTLIIYMEGNPGPARYFAERIPNVELVALRACEASSRGSIRRRTRSPSTRPGSSSIGWAAARSPIGSWPPCCSPTSWVHRASGAARRPGMAGAARAPSRDRARAAGPVP
jgi:pimeloyl-ACP methyl ester carboxylesterase